MRCIVPAMVVNGLRPCRASYAGKLLRRFAARRELLRGSAPSALQGDKRAAATPPASLALCHLCACLPAFATWQPSRRGLPGIFEEVEH